jgi:hypothetical protein
LGGRVPPGFFGKGKKSIDLETVVLMENKKLQYSVHQNQFIGTQLTTLIAQIKLGMDFNISFVTVPIDALVYPLCVIPDNSEEGCDTFYVVLPKRNWSRYFGKTIQIK